jgi:hypothetical protein
MTHTANMYVSFELQEMHIHFHERHITCECFILFFLRFVCSCVCLHVFTFVHTTNSNKSVFYDFKCLIESDSALIYLSAFDSAKTRLINVAIFGIFTRYYLRFELILWPVIINLFWRRRRRRKKSFNRKATIIIRWKPSFSTFLHFT